ncbi:extracellular solute-binding protein [Bradyrhizobium sp. SRL28]|nr:extracellular solute-binding protein [Bradyrhizobium sp. SRL28]
MRRRDFLALGAASALAAVAAPAVHAQQKKFSGVTLRINGYGGTYDKALIEGVAKPLEESTGLKIEYIPSSPSADIAKLLSNKSNPHIDLLMADSPLIPQAIAGGILETFVASDAPNLSRVLPGFREFGDYGAPFSVASIVPVYNSNTVKPPLTSFSDIARPDLKGKVSTMPANNYTGWMVLLALAEGNGGSLANMDPAFKIIAAAKDNIVATPPNSRPLHMVRRRQVRCGMVGPMRRGNRERHWKRLSRERAFTPSLLTRTSCEDVATRRLH